MGDSSINDERAADPPSHRLDTAFDLGDHAARDNPLPDQRGQLAAPHFRNQGGVVVTIPQQAADVGERNQVFGVQLGGIRAAAASALML